MTDKAHLAKQSLYAIRDFLFGQNYVAQDIPKALRLAALSPHPEAQWFHKTFGNKDVASSQDVLDVLSQLGNDDEARKIAYSCALDKEGLNVESLRKAVQLEFPFAYVLMAIKTTGHTRFEMAQRATMEGQERGGYGWLGWCYDKGVGCVRNPELAKHWYKMAAEEDLVLAMPSYARMLGKDDPARYEWLGKAASRGCASDFMEELDEQMRLFNRGSGRTDVVFALGKALKGHINVEMGEVFRLRAREDDLWDEFDPGRHERCLGFAFQAVQFYEETIVAAKRAVFQWSLVGIRKKVCKDVRVMIAKLVWNARSEADYEIESED